MKIYTAIETIWSPVISCFFCFRMLGSKFPLYVTNGKLKTHTTFLAMHLISEIFNDDELEISKRELNNFCYIYTCVKNEDVKYYYIVNWSEDSQIINLKKSIEKSNIVEYYGSELYYSTGEDQLHYSNNQVENLTKILIKPYSITLIKSEDD